MTDMYGNQIQGQNPFTGFAGNVPPQGQWQPQQGQQDVEPIPNTNNFMYNIYRVLDHNFSQLLPIPSTESIDGVFWSARNPAAMAAIVARRLKARGAPEGRLVIDRADTNIRHYVLYAAWDVPQEVMSDTFHAQKGGAWPCYDSYTHFLKQEEAITGNYDYNAFQKYFRDRYEEKETNLKAVEPGIERQHFIDHYFPNPMDLGSSHIVPMEEAAFNGYTA